jgi:hypothetical protein
MRIAVEWKMVASSRQVPPYQPMADAVRYCLREKLGRAARPCLSQRTWFHKEAGVFEKALSRGLGIG